jgi:hypothetical protein
MEIMPTISPRSPSHDAEAEFMRELEIFGTEADDAAQFLYAILAIHKIGSRHEGAERLLDAALPFWNTCCRALQAAHLIALGRIFESEKKSPHNLENLLRMAENNLEIFSKEAFQKRKHEQYPTRPDWLDEFIRNAYTPNAKDFARIRGEAEQWRKAYNDTYKKLRDKVFAHRDVFDGPDFWRLWQDANVPQLQSLHAFLLKLHQRFWELYTNGRNPFMEPRFDPVKNLEQEISQGAEKHFLSASKA